MAFWSSAAVLPTAEYSVAAAAGIDGTIYVVAGNGGTTFWAYDPSANTWATKAALPAGVSNPAAAVGPDGTVYVVADSSSALYAYNPATNAWSTKAALPITAIFPGATTGTDGKIYVVAGHSGTTSIYAYDPTADSWSGLTNLPAYRSFYGLAAGSDGTIYIIGGFDSGGTAPQSTLYAYNPTTKTLSTKAALPTGLARMGAASVTGTIYAIGGYDTTGATVATVYAYDPNANSWSSVTALPTAIQYVAATGSGRYVYVVGGQNSSLTAQNGVSYHQFDSPPNQVAWASPADGTTLNRAVDQVLNYTFSDPDVGDSQSARKWRYSTDGGTTWVETDETTTSTAITIPANTFTSGASVQVQAVSADSIGTYPYDGSGNLLWSASLHLTFENAPTPPTITAPTSGAMIGSSSVTATFSAPSLTKYQYRVVNSADTSIVYTDWTTVTDSSSRSFTVTGLPNSVSIQIEIEIYNNGLWSSAATQVNPVSYDPPPTPTLVLTEDPMLARILCQVATASPGAGQVAAVSAAITGRPVDTQIVEWSRPCPINGVSVFQTPATGVDYEFQVTATSASGTTALTAWIGSATGTPNDASPFLSGGTPANPNGVFV